MRFAGARARLFLKGLGASLAVTAGLLILAAPAPAFTPETERFKALTEENRRLLDEVLHPKSHQLKGAYARKSALRKLHKADANVEEMRAINKRWQADVLKIKAPPEVERKYKELLQNLRQIEKNLGQAEKVKTGSSDSLRQIRQAERELLQSQCLIEKQNEEAVKSRMLIEKAKNELLHSCGLIDQALRGEQSFIKSLISMVNKADMKKRR